MRPMGSSLWSGRGPIRLRRRAATRARRRRSSCRRETSRASSNSFCRRRTTARLLSESARNVAEIFTRIARAVRTINDERANLPDIADTEPERLSFLVAAAMEVEPDVKQEMLELRSTSERLRRLRDILARAVSGYEERARVHELAKGNGHSGRKVEIE